MANRKYSRHSGRSRKPAGAPGRPAESLSLPAILFDLDGTLIDSVYEHVVAWSLALRSEGVILPTWKIHRHIGMSGESFVRELVREMGPRRRAIKIDRLEKNHSAEFHKMHLEVFTGCA